MIKVKLLQHTPEAERIIALAAKLCYSPVGIDELDDTLTDEAIEKFLNFLISIGHGSPVEHVTFTYAIEGVSRITEIQLVRHRVASYSIQSGRYVNRANPEFVTPPNIRKNELALLRYERVMQESMEAYNDLFLILMLDQMGFPTESVWEMSTDDRIAAVAKLQEEDKKTYNKYEKIAIEDARYAHLQSLSTKIMVTMNARELLHFFYHRTCKRAQWEIRQMAFKMLQAAKTVCPTVFGKAGAACMSGPCSEGKMTCGEPYERVR